MDAVAARADSKRPISDTRSATAAPGAVHVPVCVQPPPATPKPKVTLAKRFAVALPPKPEPTVDTRPEAGVAEGAPARPQAALLDELVQRLPRRDRQHAKSLWRGVRADHIDLSALPNTVVMRIPEAVWETLARHAGMAVKEIRLPPGMPSLPPELGLFSALRKIELVRFRGSEIRWPTALLANDCAVAISFAHRGKVTEILGDGKGREVGLALPGRIYDRTDKDAGALDDTASINLNGKAKFGTDGSIVWCRQLAVDWTCTGFLRRAAQAAGQPVERFSYAFLSTTDKISARAPTLEPFLAALPKDRAARLRAFGVRGRDGSTLMNYAFANVRDPDNLIVVIRAILEDPVLEERDKVLLLTTWKNDLTVNFFNLIRYNDGAWRIGAAVQRLSESPGSTVGKDQVLKVWEEGLHDQPAEVREIYLEAFRAVRAGLPAS